MSAVKLTQELVRFDTINPPGVERPCAEHLGARLEAAGFAVAYHELGPGRASLVARLDGRGDRRPLCFTGHLDTVPLGAVPWHRNPHGGEIDGGRLWGRGASDMKAGVAALVTAAIQATNGRSTPAGGLVLVLTAAEETGCEGAFHLARSGALGDAGAIVVAEPTSNVPCIGHKGALWLQAKTSGVTAHGSMPEKGVNAVYKAARAVGRLETFQFDAPPHPFLGAPTLNVGTIRGGLNVNSVPDACAMGIDIRTIPGQTHGDLVKAIASCVGGEVEIEMTLSVEGVWTAPEDGWVQQLLDDLEAVLGTRPAPGTVPYFTDGSVLRAAYGEPPTVILGPGDPALAHQTDEYCLVHRIEQAVDAYERIIRRWCGA